MKFNEKLLMIGLVVVALGLWPLAAGAWVFVPPYGDTGWQTYTYTAVADFCGRAGFLVSNQGDDIIDSELLVDNLSHALNPSFETGDYTNYTLGPTSSGFVITGPYTQLGWQTYNPTHGDYMSLQVSNDDDTSGFLNYYGHSGTNGSILETSNFNLAAGETFSFDWAFMTTDYSPYEDFSKFYLKDLCDNIVFEDGLGQLQAVPVPGTLLLLGSGLLGLTLWRRRQ